MGNDILSLVNKPHWQNHRTLGWVGFSLKKKKKTSAISRPRTQNGTQSPKLFWQKAGISHVLGLPTKLRTLLRRLNYSRELKRLKVSHSPGAERHREVFLSTGWGLTNILCDGTELCSVSSSSLSLGNAQHAPGIGTATATTNQYIPHIFLNALLREYHP